MQNETAYMLNEAVFCHQKTNAKLQKYFDFFTCWWVNLYQKR